jgi:ABC-2 type transport system ATP-binding protein
LSEIEGVCDDVVILNSGEVVASGTVTEVISGAQRNGIRIQVPPPAVAEARRVLEAMPDVMKVGPVAGMAGWLQVEPVAFAATTSSDDLHVNNRVLAGLIGAHIPVLGLQAEGGRLQDVFLHLTEGAIE